MSHSHAHGHDHSHGANKKALFTTFILTTSYMVAEIIGGIITNSLALLSDATHMLSDSASLLIAVIALKLGEKAANAAKTYGYKRFEILAAALNGITLLALNVWILWQAFQRLESPPEILSGWMFGVAVMGLLINIAGAWILMKGSEGDNLNVRAALLHVLGDLLGSVGAIAASLLIMFFGWNIADPLASALIAILIFISGIRITKDSIHILMEGTPAGIDLDKVAKTIRSVKGIMNLHDLHIWSITSGKNALSCHVVLEDGIAFRECQSILQTATQKLAEIGIGHVTLQPETADHAHEDSLLCSLGEGNQGDYNHDHSHNHDHSSEQNHKHGHQH